MDLKFDMRGNLTPYDKINLEPNEFEGIFVGSFDKDSSRYEIYENYLNYIKDFKAEITPAFKQWINGSFVTNRRSPGDIDLVNLVDFKITIEKYDILREKFLNKAAIKKYKIDAYIVRIYPEDHKEYSKTHSDLLYWSHWFGHTKKNRAKKRFKKGFVELSYNT